MAGIAPLIEVAEILQTLEEAPEVLESIQQARAGLTGKDYLKLAAAAAGVDMADKELDHRIRKPLDEYLDGKARVKRMIGKRNKQKALTPSPLQDWENVEKDDSKVMPEVKLDRQKPALRPRKPAPASAKERTIHIVKQPIKLEKKKNKLGVVRMNTGKETKPSLKGTNTVKAVGVPLSIGRIIKTRPPRGAGRTVMSGVEMIGEVNATGDSVPTEITHFEINPGLTGIFPRLSTPASIWEQYRFTKLEFEYVPITSATDSGTVIFAPEYVPESPYMDTEAEMINTKDAVECNGWTPIKIKFDLKAANNTGSRKLVRDTAVAGPLSRYDTGRLTVSAWGFAGAYVVGKIMAKYSVEFYVPHVPESLDLGVMQTAYFATNQDASQTFSTGVGDYVEFNSVYANPYNITFASGVCSALPKGIWKVEVSLHMNNTVAESSILDAQLNIDGSLSVPTIRSTSAQAAISNQTFGVTLIGFITSDGTQSFGVYAQLTGATGTLTIARYKASLILTPM